MHLLPLLASGDAFAHMQDGYTALIRAALKGHTDCVRLLVEAGADKNTFDAVRKTWLSLSECVVGLCGVFTPFESLQCSWFRSQFIIVLYTHSSRISLVQILFLIVQNIYISAVFCFSHAQHGMNALAHARSKRHSEIIDLLTATAVKVLRGDLNAWIFRCRWYLV